MSIESMMASSVDGFLSAMGESLVYYPGGNTPGNGQELVGIVHRDAEFGDMDAIKALIEIPVSDLESASAGDVITVGGVSYTAHDGKGARITHDGVWWVIPAITDERGQYRERRR